MPRPPEPDLGNASVGKQAEKSTSQLTAAGFLSRPAAFLFSEWILAMAAKIGRSTHWSLTS